MRLHLFLQYKSGFENSPGDGMMTFDFIVKMFAGESGNSLVGSLIVSTVRGLEFNIPSVSTISVNNDFSSKAFHEFALPFPDTTHVVCNRWILLPLNPITTKFLH